jgi:ATP-binding cassette, subfamily B, bacterial MsbA
VFLRGNSSNNPARLKLLESLRRRAPLGLAFLSTMAVSAAATAAYAWLVGPLLRGLDADLVVQAAPRAASFPSLPVSQIVWLLVALGVVRALSETARTNLTSRFQLSTIREFRGEVLAHVLRLEPLTLLRWPRGELASRIQIEVHGVRTLLHLGVAQGIRSILMATALAIVALRVDSALAIPGLLVVPVAVVVIVLAARPAWAKIGQGAARAEERGIAAETWGAAAAPLVELAGAIGYCGGVRVRLVHPELRRPARRGYGAGGPRLDVPPSTRPCPGSVRWWSGLASLDRLDELLCVSVAPRRPAARRTEPIASLRLEDLSFGYHGQQVLNGANASLRGGAIVAITGVSGAGESTLLGLLSGVLPASRGGIWIDGAPASRESLIATTAWMPQSPSLFRDTNVNNVALGSDTPDCARIIRARQCCSWTSPARRSTMSSSAGSSTCVSTRESAVD